MINDIKVGDLVHIPSESKVTSKNADGGLTSWTFKNSIVGLVLRIHGWELEIMHEGNLYYTNCDKVFKI